jgi:replicative DNA helicase
VIQYHNISAERSLIGALLLDNKLYREASTIVKFEDFYHGRNKQIYTAIEHYIENNEPADVITISEHLGGPKTLSELGTMAQEMPLLSHFREYAYLIKHASQKRHLFTLAEKMKQGLACNSSVDDLISDVQHQLLELSKGSQQSEIISINEVTKNYIEELTERTQSKKMIGLSTGYSDIDKNINGMREGNLVIIGARPSMGKTTLALNISENLAQEDKKILFLSLEMTNEELIEKSLSSLGRVDYSKLLNGNLDDKDWPKLTSGAHKVKDSSILLGDSQDQTSGSIRKLAWDAFDKMGGLDCIVLDYLQLAQGKGENRVQEVAQISRSLKSIAKEFRCVVLATAQLNRSIEIRSDKRPKMSDLKECGQIEQDADVVLFLHREKASNLTEIITGKARKGKIDTSALLVFRGEYQRFDSADAQAWEEFNNKRHEKAASFQPKPFSKKYGSHV